MMRLPTMNLTIEMEKETDGRWLTEIPKLPDDGGRTRKDAIEKVKSLALRVRADRLGA